MGIVQENRFDAPRPEIQDTEYGAQYIKAATEKPIEDKEPLVLDEPEPEVKDPVAAEPVEQAPVEAAVSEKKKAGKPKKSDKKKK